MLRRRALLAGSLAVTLAAFAVGASSARVQDGWIGEAALDTTIQKEGVTYRSKHVEIETATCTGVHSNGIRVREITIEFHRFVCELDGADNHTYTASVRITESTATRFSWQVTHIKRNKAAPALGGTATITGPAATSGGSWVYPVTGYRFSCPGAPAGFAVDAANPFRQSPSPLGIRPNIDLYIPGTDQLTISCVYVSASHRRLTLFADMALPNTTTNPYATFDFGCGQNMSYQGGPDQYRAYLVASPNRWAYAIFTDYEGALNAASQVTFAKVARTLLHNVIGAAATCSLDTTIPIAVGASFQFSFSLRVSGSVSGALSFTTGGFVTRGGPDADNNYKVGYFYTGERTSTLAVTRNGKTHSLELSFGTPTFTYLTPNSTLTMQTTVVSSNDPSCPTGSKGTMTVRTSLLFGIVGPTTGNLSLCGLFKGETQTVTGSITTGGETAGG